MNVRISGDTVIRLLTNRYDAQPTPECGNTVGADDFSFKKRHTYRTIIVDVATHKPVAVLDGRDGSLLKEWLEQNKHVTTITRDRASAYASAIEEILPDCMQIADRFHLHQNLMDAVKKILGREIPATNAIPIEGSAPTPDHDEPGGNGKGSDSAPDMGNGMNPVPVLNPEEGKKIPGIVDNFTESEGKKWKLILKIQELHQEGVPIHEIARLTNKSRNTVKKYLEGDPNNLCRNNSHGVLEGFKDFIIKAIREGHTQADMARRLGGMGYTGSASNARQYICSVAEQYGLEIAKYNSLTPKENENGTNIEKAKVDYITRKGIFNYLWMNCELMSWHHAKLWENPRYWKKLRCVSANSARSLTRRICRSSIYLLSDTSSLR